MVKSQKILIALGIMASIMLLGNPFSAKGATGLLHEINFSSMPNGAFSSTNGTGTSDPWATIDLVQFAPPDTAQFSWVTNGILRLRSDDNPSSSFGITHSADFPPVADGTYVSGRASIVAADYGPETANSSQSSLSMDSSNVTNPGGPLDYIGRFVRNHDEEGVHFNAEILLRNNGFISVASASIPEIKDGTILSIEWDEAGLITLYVDNVEVLNYQVPPQDMFDTTTFNGVFFAMDTTSNEAALPGIKKIAITAKGHAYTGEQSPALENSNNSNQQTPTVLPKVGDGFNILAGGIAAALFLIIPLIYTKRHKGRA